MNPHTPAGPQGPPAPMPHQSRRHQEYHQQQHHQQHAAPHSPGPYNPYAYPYPPQYYGHPMHMPYQLPRWMPQQQYPPYAMQMPMHNGQRSPMVNNAQPHMPQPPPYARPMPYAHIPMPPPSPYSTSMAQSPVMSHPVSSPREPPSQSSTPQPVSRRASSVAQPPPIARKPFNPPLPWYSSTAARESFPPRARRRKRRRYLQKINESVWLPSRDARPDEEDEDIEALTPDNGGAIADQALVHTEREADVALANSESESAVLHTDDSSTFEDRAQTPTPSVPETPRNRAAKPAAPIVPALPQIAVPRSKQPPPTQNGTNEAHADIIEANQVAVEAESQSNVEAESVESAPAVRAAPKSWADLVRSKASAAASLATNDTVLTNGHSSRAGTIADVLSTFDVQQEHKIAFLEPRGLVNTGNMCYMNSILQVLVFCIPFYDFLDQVGKRAAHSFKSDTPLVDAMIMFMRDFPIIDSAESVEKLRLRLKDSELEQYGDSLIPEYVYNVINRLPRFSSMRRGHQQDAEEFLGFLLAGLHDECVAVLRSQGALPQATETPSSPVSTASQAGDGWLEVGPKQKAAVTRQAGDPTASSPITRIFGGALRSELRVPGLKNSVTLEPYQPLQLDIGDPSVNNITDALKGLTKPESLIGDFNSPRGPGTTATKQVFIESLPPVLIIHLKRFQYDSSGGTQKIWKRVGCPLEFEMPKEVFAPSKRGGMAVKGGMPRYRLNAIVYHHGKSAAGGHYTVDLLRQDRREWVRIDDTFIRRVRHEDVAEAGAEEDPKVLAKALERHQAEAELSAQRNPYEGLDGEGQEESEGGKAWSDVNGENKKRWAGVAAASGGTATPTSVAGKKTPRRDGVKDNKVAYILFYEKVSP